MGKFLHSFAMLMTILYCASAHAATDPYAALEVTPAEGTVTSLQHFTITFAGLPVTVNTSSVPTLQKGGGATRQGHISLDSDGTTVHIDFDEVSTASGDYFLNIPENTLTVNNQRLVPLTLRFIIGGDAEAFYNQITIDPAEGVADSLQNFTLSFPKYIGDIAAGSRATLRNEQTGRTYQAEMNDVGYNLQLQFPEAVTKPGDYVLTIPAGSVLIYTLDYEVQELNFHYTIEGEVDMFYDLITIDPMQGAAISLQDFTITFPETVDGITAGSNATLANTTTGNSYQGNMTANGQEVSVNFPDEVTESGNYTLTIPPGSLIVNALGDEVGQLAFNYYIKPQESGAYTINPPEGEVYRLQNFTISYGTAVKVNEDAIITLVNDETGASYECHLIEIGGNAYVYQENPLSLLGSYTLHVPAACIEIYANGTVNPELTFHYTIVKKDTYVPPVIESQPDGELRVYQRSGSVVKEVEKSYTVEEGESPYEIVVEEQEGTLSIVFGSDNKVYIQRPVSWSYYNGWIEGTLSEDGKTITVPMGQYVAYTSSFEMGVQVGIFTYDESEDTYTYDPSIDELTYTIRDDGAITQDDTDFYVILGTMNRAFGDSFQYLDYEWLQAGDFGSVYTPINEQPITPPEGLTTESFILTTANNDGIDWEAYTATVAVGLDGNDVWLKGISKYLPDAWIKGTLNGNTITFPNSQLLGSYEALLYFKAADYNPINGNTTQKDMVLTIADENTFYTYDYVFISTDKTNLEYVNYYQGLTISKLADAPVEVPEGAREYEYLFKFKTRDDDNNLVAQQLTVNVSFAGDRVYIQGMCLFLPEAWLEGQLVNGQLVLDLPQYFGDYESEGIIYPVYLNGFDQTAYRLNRQVVMDYLPQTREFNNPSTPMGFGINKTGYLNVQDIFEAALEPVQSFLTGDVNDDGRVNIGDVTDLINYLLSSDPSNINLAAADVSADGIIRIDDVSALINLLLSSN